MPDSAMLRREIESVIGNQNDTTIKFRNGSTIVGITSLRHIQEVRGSTFTTSFGFVK